MRVIGGIYRSRPLLAPRGRATRPTSDRLRETLFNVLTARVAGSRMMDLYCGTGAVGIEALSRGAQHVLFAESAPAALRVLRQNLRQLGIADGAEVAERPVDVLLRRLIREGSGAPFDLIFLDPPYDHGMAYRETLDLLGSREGAVLLAAGAQVIAEHASRSPLSERFGTLCRWRSLRQGDATLSFFASEPSRAETAESAAQAQPGEPPAL